MKCMYDVIALMLLKGRNMPPPLPPPILGTSNNNNNNNFIICIKYKKLHSLPRKIAGKLVVAGQDKYTNNNY